MAKTAAKKKTPAKTLARTRAADRPQVHGGRLQSGSPGNVGGIGRPPSALREQLRGSFADRVSIIEQIADGVCVQRTRVRITDLVPHVSCANCGESQIALSNPEDGIFVEIDAQVSASPKDRLSALDLQAKYGLGTLKEISIENVRDRVRRTLEIIRRDVPAELVDRMLPELRAAWA